MKNKSVCTGCIYQRNINGAHDNKDSCCKYPGTCHSVTISRNRDNKKIGLKLGIIFTSHMILWPKAYDSELILGCKGFTKTKKVKEQNTNLFAWVGGMLATISLFFLL